MQNTLDLLQIKIEKAKRELSEDTQNAIASVDWRMIILGLRTKKGYTFEQLGDLELETELLLCGLVTPLEYPKELETRMKISKASANELVNEMNNLVFAKIREEMIKTSERKNSFANKNSALHLEKEEETHPLLAQKFSGNFQMPSVRTDHSLENITKNPNATAPDQKIVPLKIDPYREIPE